MTAFLYEIILHWKLNFRNKEILLHFYLVPLIFYLFIGNVFITINPEADNTIASVMTVFAVTMGGVLGSPYSLVEFYGSETKKAYQVGHIPLWTVAVGNGISALLHLFLTSIIIFVTAPFLFNAPIPSNVVNYFISLFLLIAANVSIGTVFGLLFKNSSKMGMATQLIFLPSIMLSGIMFPITMLPDSLQKIGKLLPATWGFLSMCDSKLNMDHILPLVNIILISSIISILKLRKIHVE